MHLCSTATTTTTQRDMPPGVTVCFADCQLRVRACSNEEKKIKAKRNLASAELFSYGAVGTGGAAMPTV